MLSAKLYVGSPKNWRFKNSTDLLYHHAKNGGGRTSRAAGGTKKFDVFRFLSVTLLKGEDCEREIAITPFELRNILVALDRGRFVVVYPHSTLCFYVVGDAITGC